MRRAATEGGRTYIVDIWSERLPKAGSEAEYIYYICMSEQRTRSVAAAAAKLLPQPPKQYIYIKKKYQDVSFLSVVILRILY